VPLADARECDALSLRIAGLPVHVGVVVAPPWFLHTMRGAGSVVERWDAPAWARRVLGAFRHEALA
jgi:hypothetical protein